MENQGDGEFYQGDTFIHEPVSIKAILFGRHTELVVMHGRRELGFQITSGVSDTLCHAATGMAGRRV